MRKKAKKTPSRIKYDKGHPTVSARLPAEKRVKLLLVLKKLGINLARLLTNLADETEIKLRPPDEARKEGFRNGYAEAKKLYAVTYPCGKCGKPITITNPETKAAVARYMVEHGWHHNECPKEPNSPPPASS